MGFSPRRVKAIEELAAKGEEVKDLALLLKNRAECDDYAGIRYIAIRELTQMRKGDAALPAWLKDRVRNALHWDVRRTALDELASRWAFDPEVAVILRERAVADSDQIVRDLATKTLETWRNDPTVPGFLVDLVDQPEGS
jgi:hypothetical protein